MSYNLKYLILRSEFGVELGFMFPTEIAHADFLEGVRTTPIGRYQSNGLSWERLLRRAECISGGFVGPHGCHGSSESCRVKSRGHADTVVIFGKQQADLMHEVSQ